MNRQQYIDALTFCRKVEAAGAIAAEVGMLLREDPQEKRKLDIIRRIEASNRILCVRALDREGVGQPPIEASLYRTGFKLGMRFGEGDWDAFLDRFEATVDPSSFTRYLEDDNGNEITPQYSAANLSLLRHLVAHERSFVEFLKHERAGRRGESTAEMEAV